MNSKASYYDATMSFSSSLHEQLASVRLEHQEKSQSKQKVLHDSDFDNEDSDNKMISSVDITKISMMKQKNRTLLAQVHKLKTKMSRLRDLRNQYRQKTHQLREKIISLRTQLHSQQKLVLVDSDDEKHKQRQQSNRQQFDVLHIDSHFFNRVVDSALSFVKSISQSESTDFASLSFDSFSSMILTESQSRLKYSDVDDFEDDRNK